MRHLASLIATWFGCGLAPFAPGTFGALGALLPAWLLHHYAAWPPLHYAALAALATAPGIWAADRYAASLGKKDPGAVVIDEVLGQWLTLAGATHLNTWQPWLLAFALFRIFDIWKPFPVRRLEALPGGTGIVVDDLAAGLYAALTLYALGPVGLY